MTKRPRLTKQALDGLAQLAGLVEAGGPEEITGYEIRQMDAQELRDWGHVESAVRWIRGMQRHREQP